MTFPQEKFECGKCLRKFGFRQSLNRHKWKCEGLRMLGCPCCEYKTYRVDALKDHVANKHRGVDVAALMQDDQPQDLSQQA